MPLIKARASRVFWVCFCWGVLGSRVCCVYLGSCMFWYLCICLYSGGCVFVCIWVAVHFALALRGGLRLPGPKSRRSPGVGKMGGDLGLATTPYMISSISSVSYIYIYIEREIYRYMYTYMYIYIYIYIYNYCYDY